MDPVIGVLLFAAVYLGWLAVCWAINAATAPAPAASVDPCAESRARASALRAELRVIPGGKQ